MVANNIMLLFTSSELGGAEKSLIRMVAKSDSDKISYTVATLDGNGPICDWAKGLGISVNVLGCRRSMYYHGSITIKSILKAFRLARKRDVKTFYVIGFRASLAIRLFKIFMPRVSVVQGVRWSPSSTSRLDKVFRAVERKTHKLLSGYITNSQVSADILINKCNVPKEKVKVIYNGLSGLPVNVPDRSCLSLEVVTVANFNIRKGYVPFLDVVEAVKNKLPNVRFTFIGRDDLDGSVHKTISNRGLSSTVSCVDFQSDVSPFLLKASIFVLPSLWGEGCPTSILEAMSFKLPVVAYAIDGIPELVESDVDGFLYDLGDIVGMSSGIVRLLSNPSLVQSMGKSGRKKVQEKFLISLCAEKHQKALESLCVVL